MGKRGKFISIEGGEGAGKSTQIALMQQLLETAGLRVVLSREPGGTPLAEEIRSLLLARRDETMCPDTELLLMFAARMQHISALIEPALQRGDWVISDRFSDASHAYQGAGRGIDAERIVALQKLFMGDFLPDLTLLLDVPVDRGMQRVQARARPDRFEIEQHAFFERIRRGYLEAARADPQRFRVIDASRELAEVERDVRAVLHQFLDSHHE